MPFVERLRSGVDACYGQSLQRRIASGAMPTLHRYLGNPVLSFVGRLFFHPTSAISIAACAASTATACGADLRTTGMEFASEMVVRPRWQIIASRKCRRRLQTAGRARRPHLRTWRDGWRHLSFLLIYSPRWLFLYAGLFLLAFGLFTAFALLPGAVKVGNVEFDIHTFVVACISGSLAFRP